MGFGIVMDFKKLMNSEAYDFLRTNERLGNRIMLEYLLVIASLTTIIVNLTMR